MTMNMLDFLAEDLQDLRQLMHHEKIFLTFSYYSGYFIAAFNFIIFLFSMILYIKVIILEQTPTGYLLFLQPSVLFRIFLQSSILQFSSQYNATGHLPTSLAAVYR